MEGQLSAAVKEYILLDGEIKESRNATKILTARHKELRGRIIESMTEHGHEEVELADTSDVVQLKKRKRKLKPKKPTIIKKLGIFLKDNELAARAYDYAMGNEETSTAVSLTIKHN